MHNYQRSLKEPTAPAASTAAATVCAAQPGCRVSSNLERALAATSLTQQPLPCRRRLELLVLASQSKSPTTPNRRALRQRRQSERASKPHTTERGSYYTSATPKSEAEPFGSARGAYLLASPRYGALQKVTPISLEPAQSNSSHLFPLSNRDYQID